MIANVLIVVLVSVVTAVLTNAALKYWDRNGRA